MCRALHLHSQVFLHPGFMPAQFLTLDSKNYAKYEKNGFLKKIINFGFILPMNCVKCVCVYVVYISISQKRGKNTCLALLLYVLHSVHIQKNGY